ncbi:MAG: hypothetical protein OXQ30_11510 [Boseongicola sp.]|nr:hypothetical protein [Boseongicola sp.]
MPNVLKKFVFGGIAAITVSVSGAVALAETAVGSTTESRILLGFNVNPDGLETMLPEKWKPITLPKGPVAGSNLIVALIDRHLILDANSEPADPPSGPIAALLAYRVKEGEKGVRAFVTRVYEETPLVDPYGNSALADIDRRSAFVDLGGGDRQQTEKWSIRPAAGGEVTFDFNFKVGAMNWSTGGESRPYSSKDPEFFRIYRYDQLAGLVMNELAGKALDGSAAVAVSDPEMGAIFDGTEKLVSIITIPVYLRTISLP